MSDDQKEFLGCFIAACVVIIILIITVATYNSSVNNKVLKAIEAGADPVDAGMAFNKLYNQDAVIYYLSKCSAKGE